MAYAEAYRPDRSLKGKLRRQAVRFVHRRPLAVAPRRPMISFTFDDAPRTAAVKGADVLEARGVRGTFYVSSDLSGTELPMGPCAEPKDYRRLTARGHELACHTAGHLDCGQAPAESVAEDLVRNARALKGFGEQDLTSFAYPYGDVSAPAKELLGDGRFSTVRTVRAGLIGKGADLNQLPAVGIEGPRGEEIARRWMQMALAQKAWLILFTHDVRLDPSPWGCTPGALERLVDEALAYGFDVLPVREAARKLGL